MPNPGTLNTACRKSEVAVADKTGCGGEGSVPGQNQGGSGVVKTAADLTSTKQP